MFTRTSWFLVGNGGMDPYGSPLIVVPITQFPHSLLRTRETTTRNSFKQLVIAVGVADLWLIALKTGLQQHNALRETVHDRSGFRV